MKQSLIDTDILSMFFKGNKKVKQNFKAYLDEYDEINFSIKSMRIYVKKEHLLMI